MTCRRARLTDPVALAGPSARPAGGGDLAVLSAVAVVVGPLAWWALGRAIDVARRDGTLVTY